LNKLKAQFDNFDKMAKLRKVIDFNDEYLKKKAIYNLRKESQNNEEFKRKFFLMHRKNILVQKRSEMTAASQKEFMRKKMIKRLIIHTIICKVVIIKLNGNLRTLIERKKQYLWKKACVNRIKLNFRRRWRKIGKSIQVRR
jgi:hypothetical protein